MRVLIFAIFSTMTFSQNLNTFSPGEKAQTEKVNENFEAIVTRMDSLANAFKEIKLQNISLKEVISRFDPRKSVEIENRLDSIKNSLEESIANLTDSVGVHRTLLSYLLTPSKYYLHVLSENVTNGGIVPGSTFNNLTIVMSTRRFSFCFFHPHSIFLKHSTFSTIEKKLLQSRSKRILLPLWNVLR